MERGGEWAGERAAVPVRARAPVASVVATPPPVDRAVARAAVAGALAATASAAARGGDI